MVALKRVKVKMALMEISAISLGLVALVNMLTSESCFSNNCGTKFQGVAVNNKLTRSWAGTTTPIVSNSRLAGETRGTFA